MTLIVAFAILLLVFGLIGAVVKRLFRLAVTFGIVIVLLVAFAVFVIGSMH